MQQQPQPINNTQMQQQPMPNNMANGGSTQMQQQPQQMADGNPMDNVQQAEQNPMDNAPQMKEGGEVASEPQNNGGLKLNWGLVFTFFK